MFAYFFILFVFVFAKNNIKHDEKKNNQIKAYILNKLNPNSISCPATNLTDDLITGEEIEEPVCAYDNTFNKRIDFKNNFIYLNKCIFQSISSSYSGGAIYITCTFTDGNLIDKSIIDDCKFIGCSTENDGGAISVSGNKYGFQIDIINCLFEDNKAVSSTSEGGAILFEDIIISTIEGCTFINNHAGSQERIPTYDSIISIYIEIINPLNQFNINLKNNNVKQNYDDSFAEKIGIFYFHSMLEIYLSFTGNTITIYNAPANTFLFDRLATSRKVNIFFEKNCVHSDRPIEYISTRFYEITFVNECPPEPTEPAIIEDSEKFSRSNMFSESEKFSLSSKFSFSKEFSNSEKFSESNFFTKSQNFFESDKFSISNKFSESDKFSFSNDFSGSQKFTISSCFSNSGEFSDSHYFSQSHDFSSSNKFSNSDEFSNSIFFTNTDKFSCTNGFSGTNLFSISTTFSDSSKFSNSIQFSQSFSFSETEKFSSTIIFSSSTLFTISYEFSNSIEFSISQSFTTSNKFSNSNKFSESTYFTNTEKFSNSNEFSESTFFSYSSKFSNTKEFSETTSFSATNEFSNSMYFSHSSSFSISNKFTNSNQFTESQNFSPSAEPIPENPECLYYDEGSLILLNRCNFSIDEEKLIYIYVILNNFTNFRHDGNGCAIHLINCGIHCNNTVFIDCVSSSGGGGAIYINNSFSIENNATFIDVLFLRCKAVFGGALFISAYSNLFDIALTGCHFESNEALLYTQPKNENNHLFGGAAIYIMSRNINVVNCTFLLNKGPKGAVKIYNKFIDNISKRTLEENEHSISFIGCSFEQHKNSQSSIYYVDQTVSDKIDIIDCNFKGKLSKNAHYIEGQMKIKDKLNVKSCKFENEKNNSIHLFDEESTNEYDIKNNYYQIFKIWLAINGGIFVLISIFIFVILKLNYNTKLYIDEFHENESQL